MAQAKQGAHAPCTFLAYRYAEVASYSRQKITLTDEQVNILKKRITEFRAADSRARAAVIKKSVDLLEGAQGEGIAFDRENVEIVCVRSTKFCPSHIFAARSAVPLQQV
jgi:hypothetical protein